MKDAVRLAISKEREDHSDTRKRIQHILEMREEKDKYVVLESKFKLEQHLSTKLLNRTITAESQLKKANEDIVHKRQLLHSLAAENKESHSRQTIFISSSY